MTRVTAAPQRSATQHPEPVLRMPNRTHVRAFVHEVVWLTCLWLVVYGGANWIAGRHGYRVRLWTDAELAIPFIPAAVVVYLSLFPMLWLSPFVLHSVNELRTFATALAWTIVISGIGFLVLPSEPAFPPPRVNGLVGDIFRCADAINLRYNMLPSLHVAMAVVCAFAYAAPSDARWKLLWWTWAVAIAASTLATHQHHVIDVIAGAVLGFAVGSHQFGHRHSSLSEQRPSVRLPS